MNRLLPAFAAAILALLVGARVAEYVVSNLERAGAAMVSGR